MKTLVLQSTILFAALCVAYSPLFLMIYCMR